MSSVLVEYPEGLPAPTVGEVRASERRAVSTVGQLRNVRTLQRDRHGTRSVAFTFTPAQAAIFREWWVEWLQLGGGWFAANWALPWGRGPHVFRFTDPPQWQLIGGRLDGQGYWQVRAMCEIRGRGMLPTVEVMYLTSTLYPMTTLDMVEMSDAFYINGAMRTGITRSSDTSAISDNYYANGVLRSPKIDYLYLEKTNVTDPLYTNGILKSTTTIYRYLENTQLSDFAYVNGKLERKLILYSNWKNEYIQLSNFSYQNGELT